MSYKVTRTKRFDKRLQSLEPETRERIISKLKDIADKSTWRLRIGDYRAFFDILEDEIKFTTVLPRDKAYR